MINLDELVEPDRSAAQLAASSAELATRAQTAAELERAVSEHDRLRAELARADSERARQAAEQERLRRQLSDIRELAERIARSRAWRCGHGTMRGLHRVSLRPTAGDGAMPS